MMRQEGRRQGEEGVGGFEKNCTCAVQPESACTRARERERGRRSEDDRKSVSRYTHMLPRTIESLFPGARGERVSVSRYAHVYQRTAESLVPVAENTCRPDSSPPAAAVSDAAGQGASCAGPGNQATSHATRDSAQRADDNSNSRALHSDIAFIECNHERLCRGGAAGGDGSSGAWPAASSAT